MAVCRPRVEIGKGTYPFSAIPQMERSALVEIRSGLITGSFSRRAVKNEGRIEALFFLYFLALLVSALLERDLHRARLLPSDIQEPYHFTSTRVSWLSGARNWRIPDRINPRGRKGRPDTPHLRYPRKRPSASVGGSPRRGPIRTWASRPAACPCSPPKP